MAEDNKKYVSMAVNFISSMDMEEFKKNISDIDALYKKLIVMKDFLPIQVKIMLKSSKVDDFIDILKQNSKEKFEFVEKENKMDELKVLFSNLISEI